ncbi:MAG: hypothetical protein HXX08_11485 [Chloroflexi bacterium]|uniref:Uncharacterized protein n=1 Tax=Candidatus Chlorohelix allophototropha TaxID=3003348 RepID=A0A8T7M0X3_9CHLR|nr:hypothetical protein [Chloroflexota bacterium]WJW65860.1 hypothetical protein OZ401_001639 [Chloroflexota bacterium L227-S17]
MKIVISGEDVSPALFVIFLPAPRLLPPVCPNVVGSGFFVKMKKPDELHTRLFVCTA